MKKRLLLLIAVIVATGVFFLFLGYCRKMILSGRIGEKPAFGKTHFAYHMDEEYYGNLEKISLESGAGEQIFGGITSHHFLAAKEIAEFFLALKKQSPKTVVIIGPNHFGVGKGDILVSKYPFDTPWGFLYPDLESAEKLTDSGAVYNEEYPFSKEHSISVLSGFLKYYLPDTKIVPIIMKRGTTKERAENLAKKLDDILPEDAVVISSVDFSHHLGKTAAVFHDERSISAIKGFEYERVLGSEVDSPVSIYALLKYLEARGAQKMSYENTNSAEILENALSDDVTSYLFARFEKGLAQPDDKVSILSFGDAPFSRDAGESKEKGGLFEKIAGPEGNFLRGVDFISLGDSPQEDYVEREINGKKISFFGIDMISDSGKLDQYYDLIRETKTKGSYILVNIHWDSEYHNLPMQEWKDFSHALIDSGADVVIGNDSIAIQPMEIYKDKAIFYSTGSLISEQIGEKTGNGFGVGIVFSGGGARYFLFPYETRDSQSDIFSAEEAGIFCDDYLRGVKVRDGCGFGTKSGQNGPTR
jgi:AmmeMemoRadiSam system protein B